MTISKVAFDLDQDVLFEINKHIPWGSKSTLMRSITEQLLHQIKTEGGDIIGVIMEGNFRIEKTESKNKG